MRRLAGFSAPETEGRRTGLRPTTAGRPGIAVAIVAVAGLLTLFSDPALAHQVSCGDTITQDTTLHRDLTNCPGDGLVIGADNITLDLNGHTIDGDKIGAPDCELTATGVSNPAGYDGVTIQNGTVREFGSGLAGGYGRSRLRNLTVRDNRGHGIGIGAFAPDNLDADDITRNRFARNGCEAINLTGTHHVRIAGNRLEDDGMDLIGVSHALVEYNRVTGGSIFTFALTFSRIEHNAVSGGQDGIFLFFSDDNTVSGNSTSSNFFGGISVKASSRNRISDNTSTAEPAGVGLEAETEENPPVGSDGNVVSGNRSVRDGIGVLVLGSDANRIVGNRAVESLAHPPGFPLQGGSGIAVDGGSDNVIAANTIARSEKDGIRLQATPDWGGLATGNALRNNLVRSAGGDGVFVDASAGGSLLERNVASRAADDGIDIESRSTTLTGNGAFHNGDLGIEAVEGVTDGGGNRARGNGTPAQCTVVMCR
jgi:parallel beta-helix repeat protein